MPLWRFLTSSTRGAYYALVEFDKTRSIKLVGFDQDLDAAHPHRRHRLRGDGKHL